MFSKLSCSILLIFFASARSQQTVCNIFCDGTDSTYSTGARVAVQISQDLLLFTLFVADTENMAYGQVENGQPGDEIWLDRSFDGGRTWENGQELDRRSIPDGASSTVTLMYNIDDPVNQGIGALRACGKANETEEVVCSPWVRSTVGASTPYEAVATAMMQFYDRNALFPSTGWWNSGNCITALIDYFRETGSTKYRYVIPKAFQTNINHHYGNYTNEFIDDTLWWGLAWLGAYQLTGEAKYLEVAKIDADFSYAYKDDVCGGGLWWSTAKSYKNAIPNELFIKLAAQLHNAIPGDTKYLEQAIEVWNWFKGSGMINEENLVNDGLNDDCVNNGQNTWTYNQGFILGGLLELHKATGQDLYLEEARTIADAAVTSSHLNNEDGVLRDNPCEDCGGDVPSFKGIFVRNLGELDKFLPGRPYLEYLKKQVESLYANNRNEMDQYGSHWAGPFDKADGARQHCALEAFTAANVKEVSK